MAETAGPKDWLKAQKRKTIQFLLNPIEASRNHLNSAVLLLCKYCLSGPLKCYEVGWITACVIFELIVEW